MTIELYFLYNNRSRAFVGLFLDKFLPARAVFADSFPVPECADIPVRIFQSTDDLMGFLETNKAVPYGIYWNSTKKIDGIEQAMAFYTVDGNLILGLAVSPWRAAKLFDDVRDFAESKVALVGYEQRPPETSYEFEALARSAAAIQKLEHLSNK